VATAGEQTVLFRDNEGLAHELLATQVQDEPLAARHPEIPDEFALQGFEGVRAYATRQQASAGLFEGTLGFSGGPDAWRVDGDSRHGQFIFDAAPEGPPRPGGGTVHHVAFAAEPDEIEAWHERVAASRLAHPTQVVDRFYFRSVYFREPNGVLFEIATRGPGFAVDEDAAHLGERLSLPPDFEALRTRLGGILTPLPYPPPWRAAD
jgi:glyoxalase family protein